MEVRCKSTKRFLLKIDIEAYFEAIRKSGLSLEIPLLIEIPCRSCRAIEVYEIFKDHYRYIKSYKKND